MKLSVIVPVRNGGSSLERCLSAARRAMEACRDIAESELIVVDDGSADDSPAAAQAAGARLLATPAPGGHGPALARNRGAAEAEGEVLFFVDADVALHADALRRAAAALRDDPELEACFGSYDDRPAEPNFLSQYKNLLHHYVHQNASEQASTFWTGCGAIRSATFAALGGFDARTYRRPSIEDIDLGYRLRRRGGKIRLLKDMKCVHLKRWTLASLLRSDIFERGVPWTILLWRESRASRAGAGQRPLQLDLNLQASNRLSVVLAGLLVISLGGLVVRPAIRPAALALAAALVVLNWRLYAFLAGKRGPGFALAAIPWHWLFYLYNSLSFTLGTISFFVRGAAPVGAGGEVAANGEAAPTTAEAAEGKQALTAGGDRQ